MQGIEEYYEKWNKDIEFANEVLFDQFGGGENAFVIDEVALFFRDRTQAMQWILDQVGKDGVTLFNYAQDEVHTHPFNTDYDVHYYFLSTPFKYRVEAMALGNGLSPLHESLRPYASNEAHDPVGPRPTVHYSFKCQDAPTYHRVTDWLGKMEFGHVQTCRSTYGLFSYWSMSENVDPNGTMDVYLKPRVNTRDERVPVDLGPRPDGGYLSAKAGK